MNELVSGKFNFCSFFIYFFPYKNNNSSSSFACFFILQKFTSLLFISRRNLIFSYHLFLRIKVKGKCNDTRKLPFLRSFEQVLGLSHNSSYCCLTYWDSRIKEGNGVLKKDLICIKGNLVFLNSKKFSFSIQLFFFIIIETNHLQVNFCQL